MSQSSVAVHAYSEHLPAVVAGLEPGQLIVDFGTSALEPAAIAVLSQQHREWRTAGWSIAYVAACSATRGALVVALSQAADHETVVATSIPQATVALEQHQRRLADALLRLGVRDVELAARPSTLTTRTMATSFGWLSSLQLGYKTPFIETMLRLYGVSAMPQLGPALQRGLDELTAEKGPLHAQAVAAFAALGNGCPFCSYGHLYAADLLYFEQTGELCPIDPAELAAARARSDAEVMAWIASEMTGPVWSPVAEAALRLHALREGSAPTGDMDELLLRLLASWTLINECSLQVQLGTVPPLHPRMARARRLQRAYRTARSSSPA